MTEQTGRLRTGGRVAGGYDDEFADYVRRREQPLLRTAYLLTGDAHHAEDLVQSALIELYRSWERVRDPDARDAYVRRILVNANNSAWRRAWRRREVPATNLILDEASPAGRDSETKNLVWDQLRALPTHQRTVLVLRYFDDLSIDSIADLLGVPPGTVKSRANRALATLRANPALADMEDWS